MRHQKTVEEALAFFDGREIEISVKPVAPMKTAKQLRLYRGYILPEAMRVMQDAGMQVFDPEAAHRWLKLRIGGLFSVITDMLGKSVVLVDSLADKTRAEVATYITKVIAFIDEYGGTIELDKRKMLVDATTKQLEQEVYDIEPT